MAMYGKKKVEVILKPNEMWSEQEFWDIALFYVVLMTNFPLLMTFAY